MTGCISANKYQTKKLESLMNTMLKNFICLLALLCLATPALAGSIKEYSADMVEVKSGRVTQKNSGHARQDIQRKP